MSFFKDLYIDEVERIAADLEDQGVDSNAAYSLAPPTKPTTRPAEALMRGYGRPS